MSDDLDFASVINKRQHLLSLCRNADFLSEVAQAFKLISACLKTGNKVLIFGNGGSAAEAQHFAGELVCQFARSRRALPAIALTTDSSILTAQSNDYGFQTVFSRQIEALGRPNDVAVGMTTSDAFEDRPHSLNILRAFQAARRSDLKSVGLFSTKTKTLLDYVDVAVRVPHESTALIQEGHLMIVHIFSEMLEAEWKS